MKRLSPLTRGPAADKRSNHRRRLRGDSDGGIRVSFEYFDGREVLPARASLWLRAVRALCVWMVEKIL